jgi:uncharacterized protein YeaO (DUF488 family)
MEILLKRAYEKPEPDEGVRILVDRIWPRGMKKEDLRLDGWMKDIAPSTALRKWFGHDPRKWDEFRRRYFDELDGRRELVDELRKRAEKGRLTLVFGARETRCNHAAALKEYLINRADLL